MSLLTVCINTRNRKEFLEATLNSILGQDSGDYDVFVVDGASTDGTDQLLEEYSRLHRNFGYFISRDFISLDEGYELVVQKAQGDYCWLMSDDDLIKPGSINRIVNLIRKRNCELILLNIDCYTQDLSLDLHQKLIPREEDCFYGKEQKGQFLADIGFALGYLGCIVMKREVWFSVDRQPFIGTYFVPAGVILKTNEILSVYYLSDPEILYRSGNQSWTARSFEIWYFKWPRLIWGFTQYPESVREAITPAEPWHRFLTVLKSRAMGEFTLAIYKQHLRKSLSVSERLSLFPLLFVPVIFFNTALVIGCALFRRKGLYTMYNLMMSSPWRGFTRFVLKCFGINFPPALPR